jgi:hypothetical protein
MKGNERKFAFISFYLLFGIGTFQRVTTKKAKKTAPRSKPALVANSARPARQGVCRLGLRARAGQACHRRYDNRNFLFTQVNVNKFGNSICIALARARLRRHALGGRSDRSGAGDGGLVHPAIAGEAEPGEAEPGEAKPHHWPRGRLGDRAAVRADIGNLRRAPRGGRPRVAYAPAAPRPPTEANTESAPEAA